MKKSASKKQKRTMRRMKKIYGAADDRADDDRAADDNDIYKDKKGETHQVFEHTDDEKRNIANNNAKISLENTERIKEFKKLMEKQNEDDEQTKQAQKELIKKDNEKKRNEEKNEIRYANLMQK